MSIKTQSDKSGPSQNLSNLRRKSNRETEENLEALVVIPPDGGWGWCVVAAAFLCNFVADGTIYTFAIFLYDISETFNTQHTNIAIANSLMTGFYFTFGPISCALVNKFGFRFVGFLGGLISSAAFLSSSSANSVPLFLVCYGLLGGFGFCMIYAPSILAVGFYFEKWRALAMSAAVCGSALGIIGFPIIMDVCFKNFDWITKFRISAGCCLMCGLLAFVYRPLESVKFQKDEKKVQFEDESNSIGSFHIQQSAGFFSKLFQRFHNTRYPTASKTNSSIYMMGSNSSLSVFIAATPDGSSTSTYLKPALSKWDDKSDKLSTVAEEDDNRGTGCCKCCRKLPKKTSNTKTLSIKTTCSAITETSVKYNFPAEERNRCERFGAFCKRISKCQICCTRVPRSYSVNRPLYRDDILYTGSLFTLPEYSRVLSAAAGESATKQSMDYHLSVSRVLTETDIKEEGKFCKCCPEAVKRTLATMLDASLLESPSFILLIISGFLTILGMFTPFIYLAKNAQSKGVSKEVSEYLLSAVGVSNCVGRIVSGIISSLPNANILVISYVSLFVCGFATIFYVYLHGVYEIYAYAIVFGLSLSTFSALRTCIVVEMVGLKQLTNALGLTMLFQGGACFMGLPLAGEVEKATKSSDYCFIVSGCSLVLSAILLVPVKWISKWEKIRKINKEYK